MKNQYSRGRSATILVLALAIVVGGAIWLTLALTANGQNEGLPFSEQRTQQVRATAPAEALRGADGKAGQRSAVGQAPSVEDQATQLVEVLPLVQNGTVHGIVLDDFDRPFASATVELHERKRGLLSSQALDGRNANFTFPLTGAGVYSVRINEASLPEGVLGPWRQDAGSPGAGDYYQAKKIVVPAEGGRYDVELRVFIAAIVRGVVVGPGGEPVEGVQVRLQGAAAAGQPSSLCADAHSDVHGMFEMDKVRSGLYRVQVITESAKDESYQKMVSPMPLELRVNGADFLDVGTLQIGGGSNTIRGRIVNQDGAPFEGVTVICYHGAQPSAGFMPIPMGPYLVSALTDSFGAYQLPKLPDALIKVQIASDYMEQPLGQRRAAFWVEPLELDLRSGRGLYDAPLVTVPESRPFTVSGSIVLDAQWAEANRMDLGRMQIAVKLDDELAAPAFTERRPSFMHNQLLAIDKQTGNFAWRCETPHQAVKLIVSAQRCDAAPIEIVVFPTPNDSLERVVNFPQ